MTARTRANRAGTIGNEHLKRLGRSDAVDDVDAVARLETFVEGGRQRLTGGDGKTIAGQIEVGALACVREQHPVPGRHGIKECRPVAFDDRVDVGRRWRTRPEDRGSSDGQREVQTVAQTVGEEQLRDAERPVAFRDAEHLFSEQLRAHDHVVLQMNAPFRHAGAARRVQPERRRVTVDEFRLQRRLCLFENVLEPVRAIVAADDNHVLQLRPRRRGHLLHLRQESGADNQHRRARVADDVLVIGRFPQRVQRDGDGADLERAEESVREPRTVMQQEQHTLLRTHAEPSLQGVAAAIDVLVEVAVAHPLVAALDRRTAAPPLRNMAVHEVTGHVEPLGYTEGIGGRNHECVCSVPDDVRSALEDAGSAADSISTIDGGKVRGAKLAASTQATR